MPEREWSWSARWNSPRNLRQRVGAVIRRLADRFDRRTSVAFEVRTSPPVPRGTVLLCVLEGQRHAQRLIQDEVMAAACEDLLRDERPDLFQDA